jgi:hypothetical protein
MALTKQWARARVLVDSVSSLGVSGTGPGNTEVDFTGPNSPPTSILRMISYMRVSTRYQFGVGVQPPGGWWESAQVTVSATWIPDGSALSNPNEMGEADPPAESLGFAQLYPEVITGDTNAGETSVVWTLRPGEFELRAGRRTDSGPSPVVAMNIWTLDSHSVFANFGHTYAVKHSIVGYFSLLFGNQF